MYFNTLAFYMESDSALVFSSLLKLAGMNFVQYRLGCAE